MTPEALTFYPLMYLLVPAAFIMGSIPFGLLVTRHKGVDIRTIGSGNIGATNVLRSAGKWSAVLTLLGDALKGLAPVLMCNYLISLRVPAENAVLFYGARDFWGGLTGLSAVAGHIFSVFLSFKGGKGVATGLGVLIAYSPVTALAASVTWIAVAAITKYSSLAAIIAVGSVPVTFALLEFSAVKVISGMLIAILIVFRHKENIKRLIEKRESKIGELRVKS
ncbi:MAG: glycerol-3-phosphate 1-O-acyltransferase PlsY [Nitrospirae bacterium]|nr:glycerol-3-phosphate 1-O-acyltransferase PlsY [Nitrospirota bacterium]